ncbi:hypothetical protein N181_01825 [Sinorhizobium fredii USDA 205]|nr:OmpA family protein [Sinorhizobium fredii]KSV87364.1 hypothetical protein N181_01825 [Sinorhizobium fredii USDA 205]
MSTDTAANLEHKGYSRGLILGFTMAESMLLLVFCLLLVTGAMIVSERMKAGQAIEQAEQLRGDLAEKAREIDDLEAKVTALGSHLSLVDKRMIDDEWRELVLARDTVRKLEKRGIGKDSIDELLKSVEVLQERLLDVRDPEKLRDRVAAMAAADKALPAALEEQKRLKAALAMALDRAAKAEGELAKVPKGRKPHEWPPIITLSEANNNYFRSGSAELTERFASKLKGPIPIQIADNLKNYDADIIEVIGHTDEQPISRPVSNMDEMSTDVVAGKKPISALIPADNSGLGLARAISVANVLRANKALGGVTILPLSAAQLVLPGDTLTRGQAGDVETRRRIEIRIRRRDASPSAAN